MDNLPDGFTSPYNTSAIALPASIPACQTCNTEVAPSITFVNTSGRPLMSTTTTGLPVA